MKGPSIFLLAMLNGAAYAEIFHVMQVNQSIALDVLGQNPLTLDASALGPIKAIQVRYEYSGFECSISDLQVSADKKTLIKIGWSPGADRSGCQIEVSGSNGQAIADLYMNYL